MSEQDQAMAKNVQRALAVELQDLSSLFRNSQSAYLKSMPCRLLMHHIHAHLRIGMKTKEEREKAHNIFGDDDDTTAAAAEDDNILIDTVRYV